MTDATCHVEACPEAIRTRGWCGMHYARWLRTGSVEPVKSCKDCGAAIARHRRSKTRCEPCHKESRRKSSVRSNAACRPEAPATYVCQDCKGEFPRMSRRSFPKRCAECRELQRVRFAREYEVKESTTKRAHFERHGRPSTCGHCGATIANDPTGTLRLTCAPCKSIGLKTPVDPSRARNFNCEACGEVFSTLAYGGVPTRCVPCRAKHERAMLHRNKQIYKARLRRSKSERFLRQEIYERDQWRCGICRKEINQELPYPDPMSASIDHIMPVSLGGSHTRANVRASHLLCNKRRGARVGDEQLMLVDKSDLVAALKK